MTCGNFLLHLDLVDPHTSTGTIRKMSGVQGEGEGEHVVRVLIMEALTTPTTLQPQTFMSAWPEIVVCHYFL